MCWFFKFTNFPILFFVYGLNLVPQRVVISILSPYVVSHTWFFQLPTCYSLLMFLRPVSPLYFLLQLHGIAYTQSLVMFSTMGVLTRERYMRSFWRLSWCYTDYKFFVFSLITPSHKTGRLFSECCSPPSLISTYSSFWRLLPCTQGNCYVIGHYLY